MQQLFPARLQQVPVLNSGRADLFARAATEATIDVRAKRVGSVLQSSFRNGAHQVQPPAWPIVLVAGDYIGRTGLETEAAMNAREQFFFLQ